MTRQTRYSPELQSRAVRMVFEHRGAHASKWAPITSIALIVIREVAAGANGEPYRVPRRPRLLEGWGP
jgi:hypothetical protein